MSDIILLKYNILLLWILSLKLAYKHALELINITAPINVLCIDFVMNEITKESMNSLIWTTCNVGN